RRKESFDALWKLFKSKEALMYQRSRSKWLNEGDANTKFFHNSVKSRSKSNLITALHIGDEWLDTPDLIKGAVSSYFENHVSSTPRVRPKLEGVGFPILSKAENLGLILPFTIEEIEEVVKSSDGNKRPMPDGFNYAFLKKFWEMLKGKFSELFI
ncbi:transposon TX1 putative protein, partial [Trifolium medium]|nr:transposon TX1 putative protein [Trifolium medium]